MMHVLVVDDQPGVLTFFDEELTEDGYQVTGVSEVESMWEELDAVPMDIVLLDLHLGKIKGWNVLHQLKKEFPELPVLIISAYDSYMDDSRLSQADGYWLKSFTNLDDLKQKITAILNATQEADFGNRPHSSPPPV